MRASAHFSSPWKWHALLTPERRPSEFELIALLQESLAQAGLPSSHPGFDDDCAVLPWEGGQDLLYTVDALVEGVHFRLEHHPLESLGYKAIAVSLSDVAAMGGEPLYGLASLAIPDRVTAQQVRALYAGIRWACEEWGTRIVGGNVARSPHELEVHVTVVGRVEPGGALLRSGGRAGEALYVTGWLGLAAWGLRLLLGGRRMGAPASPGVQSALERHLTPKPRLAAGRALRERGLARAVIDLSDGLSSDLHHLCRRSGVGARLHAEAIPVHEEMARSIRAEGGDPLELALNGGEDYELLFAVPSHREGEVAEVLGRCACHAHRVGELTDRAEGVRLRTDGRESFLEPRGYDHLRRG